MKHADFQLYRDILTELSGNTDKYIGEKYINK